jgi:hypothetical protein
MVINTILLNLCPPGLVPLIILRDSLFSITLPRNMNNRNENPRKSNNLRERLGYKSLQPHI